MGIVNKNQANKKKTYKVLFKGIILPGYDQKQVIDNVYNLTRIPKATIKRKFFSGKTVIIRHTNSQEDASRLQNTFAEAGIETYIEKVPKNQSSSSSQKKLLIVTTTTIITIIVLIFYYTLETVNETDTAVEHPTSAVEIRSHPEKAPVIKGPSFNVLIKITNITELKRLRTFLPLFDIATEHFDSLNIRDLKHKISIDNPLYLFKTNQESGLFFSIDSFPEKNFINQHQKQLNSLNNKLINQSCSDISPVFLYNNQQNVLISSKKTKNNEDIQVGNFRKAFKSFEQSLNQSEQSTDKAFTLYYQINNKLSKQSHGKHLILAVQGNTFWLQQDESLQPSNIKLLEHLGINNTTAQQLSNLAINNLSELMLLIIGEEERQINTKTDKPVKAFIKEMIAPIQTKSSIGITIPYQQELDIEMHPQWQSGPFAITTDNYHFDKHLIIEIQAKGQNINNLMEYSNSAKLTTHAAYTANKENILYNDCTELTSLENSFKNLDGEQEAYVNDEFVTYHAATAKKAIRIQPGYQLDDVAKISGQIHLNQPETIINKEIITPSTVQFNHFEHFSIMTNRLNKQTINYQIVGDKNYFLTIRAYNQSGDILETTVLKETALLNNSVSHYEQAFSEPFASIKIFFTNKLKTQKYPFSFKPEIMVTQSPFILSDNAPVPFDSTKSELTQLSGKIEPDNPQWLGQKVSEKILVPFNISLFLHQANVRDIFSQKKDAVLNIKTGITSLISQNISSVKLDLSQKQQSLFNNFITFSEKELSTYANNSISKENELNQPELYLDSNSAFEFVQNSQSDIHGSIHLSLPTSFKNHTSKYLSPGQTIKLGNILVKPVKINKQKVQFQIKGKLSDLVQLKLYNSNNQLISEPLEFTQIEKDKALLTLFYYDKIDTIKLVMAQESIQKRFPFVFATSTLK